MYGGGGVFATVFPWQPYILIESRMLLLNLCKFNELSG